MQNSFNTYPAQYSVSYNHAQMNQMGRFKAQREFHHDNNLRINQQDLHESPRPQLNQPNNQTTMWLNATQNHMVPQYNNNHLVNNGLGRLGQQSFNEKIYYFNSQNPIIKHTIQYPPYQHNSLNYTYQQSRYEPYNPRTNRGQYHSDFSANQSNIYFSTNYQQPFQQNKQANTLFNNRQQNPQNFEMNNYRQNHIGQIQYLNQRYLEPQQFSYPVHNGLQPFSNDFKFNEQNDYKKQVRYNRQNQRSLYSQIQDQANEKLKYQCKKYGNQNKTKPHSNVNATNLMMGQNNLTQKGFPSIVHFDSSQSLAQKSDVQLFLDQIQQVNNDLECYIGEIKEGKESINRRTTNLQELKRKLSMIKQVIAGSYKVFSEKDSQKQQKELYNYKRQFPKRQQKQGIDFNTYELIDFQDQFTKLVKISEFYFDGSQRYFHVKNTQRVKQDQQKLKSFLYQTRTTQTTIQRDQYSKPTQAKGLEKEQSHLSSEQCISVFIKLVMEITNFYQSNYLISKLSNDPLIQMNFFVSQWRQTPPLLIVNIIWHIQAIRLILKSYQHQLIANLLLNTEKIIDNHKKRILERIKLKWVQMWNEVQDLMVDFLQEIMISPQNQYQDQQNPDMHRQTQQAIWFFYYEYSKFNHNWINTLFETLLQTQMYTGINLNQVLQQISFNEPIQDKKFKQIEKNADKKDNRNQIKYIKYKRDNKSHQSDQINPQVQNNLLSILSFLLYPHTYNKENPQSNPIHDLLEAPIKQLITQHIKLHQRQTSKMGKQNNENTQSIKKYIIRKYLTIQKLTSIISFYASKLVSSKSTSVPKPFHQANPQFDKDSNKLGEQYTRINCKFSQSFRAVDKSSNCQFQFVSDRQNKGIKGVKPYSIELKVMELTLFVRQMADILIHDRQQRTNPEKLQNKSEDIAKNQTQLCLKWITKKFSIRQILSSLFEKIFDRKKRQP